MLHGMRRAGLLLVVTIASACGGCRLAPLGAQPASTQPQATMTAAATAAPTVTSVPTPLSGAEAPSECGFPAGTALVFAGRSTTSALNVQEVLGDPMSDDPADIYITHETFDQGDLHGRLVCAIYVESEGFVEVTVHPDDGGRFVPPTPYPSTTAPAGGLSQDAAIDAARAYLEQPGEWDLTATEAGPIEKVLPHVLEDDHYEWAQDLAPDRWVWRVSLQRSDEAVDVLVDYIGGSVLGTAMYIVN
jgi:hypothetical protein